MKSSCEGINENILCKLLLRIFFKTIVWHHLNYQNVIKKKKREAEDMFQIEENVN